MNNFKKAAQLKLRFRSKFGVLSTEQLYDIKMTDLKKIIIDIHTELEASSVVKDDLNFLDNVVPSKEEELNQLRFEILKEIYTSRINEAVELSEAATKKKQRDHLAAIIAEKKEADLRSLSVEELEKKLAELN